MVPRSVPMMTLLFAVAFAVGCNKKKTDGKNGASEANTALCEKAATKYEGCVEKVLGKEAAQLARSKRGRGIPACARDTKTVAMYRKCLPVSDCNAFMKCLQTYAEKHGP